MPKGDEAQNTSLSNCQYSGMIRHELTTRQYHRCDNLWQHSAIIISPNSCTVTVLEDTENKMHWNIYMKL